MRAGYLSPSARRAMFIVRGASIGALRQEGHVYRRDRQQMPSSVRRAMCF